MFPRLRQQLLARLDVAVELATLGSYGVDDRGVPMALDADAPAVAAQRVRDRCAASAPPRRCAMASGRAAAARP